MKRKDKEEKKQDDKKDKRQVIEDLDQEMDNFGSIFDGLRNIFVGYGRNITKLPWKEMPKEGIFLMLFTLSFMIISFIIWYKISRGGGLF